METNIRKVTNLLGSRWIFGATVLLFMIETFWLAITSRFPMAFDEAYHLGLIQFFSHRWSPIVTTQPPDSYKYGAIVHGTSLLYHYLMSFPYRLMELFTSNPTTQVIGLRFIDIALMVVNLFILKRLLRLFRISDALVNVVVLIFAFTPLVTVLSAQISYDNLLIPLTTLSIYETILLIRELDQRSFNSRRFLYLFCLCLLAGLVKFAFLPIFVAITIVVAWKLIAYWRADRVQLLSQATRSFNQSGTFIKTALLLSTALSVFLFAWFYGVDIVRYHNPVPQCNQLLGKQDCLKYYPWSNNYHVQQYIRAHPAASLHLSIGQFTVVDWMFYMSEQLYGVIFPIKGLYYISAPLYSLVLLYFAGSLVCTAYRFKKVLRKHSEFITLLLICVIYLLFLWGRNYWDYRQLGLPTAISSRYLVPILAYLYVTLGLGISYTLGHGRLVGFTKVMLAIIIIIAFVSFGGFSQYITHITPKYGHLSGTNSFVLEFTSP